VIQRPRWWLDGTGRLGGFGGNSLVSLLGDRHADAFALGKRHPRLGALADGEDVIQPGGEGMSGSILDVNDVEGSGMSLAVHDDANSPQVTTSGHHANVAGLELDEVGDFAGGDVDLDAILGFDQRIGVSDRATVGGGEVRNALGADRHLLDDAKLVRSFLFADTMHLVSAFNVVDETEVLSALLHFDDVHEPSWVSVVGADASVDLDEPLGEDLLDFRVGERVLETIPQEKSERQALAQLVRTGRGTRSVTSSQFVEHPMSGRCDALHMLTGTANHFEFLVLKI